MPNNLEDQDQSRLGFEIKNQTLIIQNLVRTDQEGYFEHLKRFLMLIEPIIEDLKRKGFI